MTLVSVEFPGYVKNQTAALETMGGIKSIQMAFTGRDKQLSLNLNPSNVLHHPIIGLVINSTNILVKVTRKRRKALSTDSHPQQWSQPEFVVVDVIENVCRFRALSDYQVTVQNSDPLFSLVHSMNTFDVKGINDFKFSPEKDLNGGISRIIPPPLFSRQDRAMPFRYVQVKHNKQHPGKHGRRNKRILFDYATDFNTIPQNPTQAIIDQLKDYEKDSDADISGHMARLKVLFAKQPIWARLPILNNLLEKEHALLRMTLPMLAYTVRNGAFKDCWIRYGVNPTSNPSYKIYQVVNISVCDLHDPEIQKLLLSNHFNRQTYDEKSGWYTTQFLEEARIIIKERLYHMNGEELNRDDEDSDADRIDQSVLNDDDRRIHDRIQMDDYEDKPMDDDQAQTTVNVEVSKPKSSQSKATLADKHGALLEKNRDEVEKSKVSDNVENMMKSFMNSAKNLVENEVGDGINDDEVEEVEEKGDFFDVFGDDSDDDE